MKSLRAAFVRWAEGQNVTASGLIVGRRVGPARGHSYAVQLDVHFEHLGQSRQVIVEPVEFANAAAARQALERWPIGSSCRLRFHPARPADVTLAG